MNKVACHSRFGLIQIKQNATALLPIGVKSVVRKSVRYFRFAFLNAPRSRKRLRPVARAPTGKEGWDFWWWLITWRSVERPKLRDMFAEHPNAQVHILRSQEELDRLLSKLARSC